MTVVPAFRVSNPARVARAGAAALWLAIMLGTTGSAVSQTANADRVVAIVNGTPIHESEIQMVDELVGRNLTTQDKVERHEAVLKMLVDTILLSQVAKERNIVDEAELQRRVTFARNQGMMTHLLSVVGEQAVTEQSIRKAYEDVVVKGGNQESEMHLRHIFFPHKDPKDDALVKEAEEKAKAALKRIKSGEDFAAVATDVSEDPITKARGGDYAWRVPSEMGKEYADAAIRLKNGEVSPLIRTTVGWHIIKLEDQRLRKPIELEKVRDRVAAMVSANAQFELVDKMRETAKIERFDTPGTADKQAPKGN